MSLQRRPAYWTYDAEANAYYFAPTERTPSPYREQRHVTAILDIASDGTLAGVELVFGELPPPPAQGIEAQGAETSEAQAPCEAREPDGEADAPVPSEDIS